MHIICSFIEPSGVTLACDDIQTYAHKIISEQICTTLKKPYKKGSDRNPYKIALQSGHSRGVSATESRATLS